ncbi:hypothetical protein PPGU19_025320 [Paraburkholderia sp. PGU19]|nr:hypothetical protein PPGU19_025320 [Paraburkholderia sp. PGU19]
MNGRFIVRRLSLAGREYALPTGRFRAAAFHWPLSNDEFEERTDAARPEAVNAREVSNVRYLDVSGRTRQGVTANKPSATHRVSLLCAGAKANAPWGYDSNGASSAQYENSRFTRSLLS